MPVISSGRYSTSSSTASYLSSPSSSTVGTFRSSYDSGRSTYRDYTSSTAASSYRASTYLPSTYRSGLSSDSSPSTRYSSSSSYGVSRDKVSSLLPPTPPSSSSITNRRSESRQRDLISNSNKDYTPTTNSTLSSNNTLKTANSLSRLSRFGSSGERSSSLARNLATCGVDLYEKYSPSTYVAGTASASAYVPKTELTRSRSLSEASKFFVNNNNTIPLSSNSHYNYNNNNNGSSNGSSKVTGAGAGDNGLLETATGDKVNQQQLQPLASLSNNHSRTECLTSASVTAAASAATAHLKNNKNNNNIINTNNIANNTVNIIASEFDSNKNKVAGSRPIASLPQKLYATASNNDCCVSSTNCNNNNNNNGFKNNINNNKNSQISCIIESYNSRMNVQSAVNNININNNNSSSSVTKNNTSITTTTTSSTKLNNISKQSVTATTTTTAASSSSSLRNKPHQPNNMTTNLSRKKGYMSNESLNKAQRNSSSNNFNFSSYKNENFLKNECDLARREALLTNQKKQKQTINDNLKNNSNPQLTIFDINNPTKLAADQHKRMQNGGGKMMNGFGPNNSGSGKLTSRIDDDIKFIDSDEVSATKDTTKKRVDIYRNGGVDVERRHRPSETSELNKITQKILNKSQTEQQQRGRDKSKTNSINKAALTNGTSEDEIKFIDSDEQHQQQNAKTTTTNTSSLTLSSSSSSSTSSTPPSTLTNNSHHHKNHLINNLNNTKNQTVINHKCDKVNNIRSTNNNNHMNSSTESSSPGGHQPTKSNLMEKVESPIKTSTVTIQITPKKSQMAATSVTATSATATVAANNTTNNGNNSGSTTTTCDDVNLTNLLIDNNKLTNKLNDESLRGTSSLRNALPSSTSSYLRDRDSGLSSSSSTSSYRSPSILGSRDYSDGYTSKRSSLLSGSSSGIDRERKSSVTEHVEGLCGLWNIGNTCFMNSVVQCLSHTSELTKFLRSQSAGSRASSERKDQRILNEFVKLIKEMWSASSRSVNPSEFKMALSSKYRMYSGSTQQDAQEFLRFFLDSLHTALNTAQKAEPVTIDDDMSDTKKADLMWDWYSKTENSMIKDLFVGQLRSTLKCSTCGNTSVTFDPFWDLSLPLPSNTRCKLENCLELFIKEEIMDGDEMPNCSKCKTRRKSTKTFTIQRFPKYLVIHLKRFSETRWSKLTNIVDIPTGERELNLAPYASDKSATCLYSLYGISNHMGSTAGGHYVAACKHASTKKWHEFNDNSVSDISESNLVSSSAYLLFFERV